MSELNGQCLCGAVTLAFEPADQLSACHCKSCQRWAGGVFLEIDVKPGTLRYEGPVKAYQSSDFAERAWCDQCGSTLWYHVTIPGHDYHSVAAGLVDDAGGLQMKLEIYVDDKPRAWPHVRPWFPLDVPRPMQTRPACHPRKFPASSAIHRHHPPARPRPSDNHAPES